MIGSDHSDGEEDLTLSPPLIIYASETGTSQDIACSIHRHLLLHSAHPPDCPPPLPVSIQAFDHLTLPSLATTPIIFVVSTTGNGEPPRHLRPLWNMLLRKDLPDDILDDVSFTVFGVGDSGYERFNWAGKILRRRLLGLGGVEFMESAEWWADERAGGGLDVTLQPFLRALTSTLLPAYYPPPIQPPPPLPSIHLFPPTSKLTLLPTSPPSDVLGGLQLDPSSANSYFASSSDAGPKKPSAIDGIAKDLMLQDSGYRSGLATPSGQKTPAGGEEGWFKGTLTKFERMTEEGWNQDVRFVEIKTEKGLIYSPGSILQLLPSNSSASVARFLALQPHLPPPSQRLVYSPLSASRTSTPVNPGDGGSTSAAPAEPHQNLPLTLLELLRDHLDLSAVPRRSFFQWMRCFTEDEREQERLDEFLHLEDGGDDLYEYVQQPRRTLLEVLDDFHGVKIPLEYLPEVLGRIRRREFSIAGCSIAHPGSIQLCIALVSFKTSLKLKREGLCSAWLNSLSLGASIPIHVTSGTLTLPSSPATPLILVGPGTGVAPLRACIEHRILNGATDTTLYFGCRSLAKDYLFQSDWEKMVADGKLTLRVAASRDQEDKVYVQHLLRADAASVFDKIYNKGGHVFISGSSNAMPRAVKSALLFSLTSVGGLSEDAGKAYLERMEAEGRLGEECWS